MSEIIIEKADGTREPFQVEKLRSSLRRAEASKTEVQRIVSAIERELREGMKTEYIYRKAFELLREHEMVPATKYSLRRALFNLGPTGFPFEDFIAQLLTAEGYTTHVRIEANGKCAPHELDVVAYKADDCLHAEAKFHVRPGIKSDLQDVLYSYARFLDLKGQHVHPDDTCGVRSGWVITNTKFTRTATEYAECVGMNLLSWGYPKENNLQMRIERSRLYPITALQTLSVKNKQVLLEQGVILCTEIIDNEEILRSAGISGSTLRAAMEESRNLCTSK